MMMIAILKLELIFCLLYFLPMNFASTKPKSEDCSHHTNKNMGILDARAIPNHRITASSYYSQLFLPQFARIGHSSNRGWLAYVPPKFNNNLDRLAYDPFLQIDFGSVFIICGVVTFKTTVRELWVKNYILTYSLDHVQWQTYWESGQEKSFTVAYKTTKTRSHQSIKNPFEAKFVRVHTRKEVKIDFKGYKKECTSPLGIENKSIADSSIWTASSQSSSPSNARLYGPSSWCSSGFSPCDFIGVSFDKVKQVTGIAVQGDPKRHRMIMKIKINYNVNRHWYWYREGQDVKIFIANTYANDIVVHWFKTPIAAKHVKVYPNLGTHKSCLRFDLYGCDGKNVVSSTQQPYTAFKSTKIYETSTILPQTILKPAVTSKHTTTSVEKNNSDYVNISTIVPSTMIEQEPNTDQSSSPVPMIIYIVIGTMLTILLVINGCLLYKLLKNKKRFKISLSTDGQPMNATDTLSIGMKRNGLTQARSLTTHNEKNQSTDDTSGDYEEAVDNNISSRPIAQPNKPLNPTYMPLKKRELSVVYHPLQRNGNGMGHKETNSSKKPAEYLEILPEKQPNCEKDLTAQYEDMSLG